MDFFSLSNQTTKKNQQAQRHFILPLTEHHLEHVRTSFTCCMLCAEVLVCMQYNNLLSYYLNKKGVFRNELHHTTLRLVSHSSPSWTFGCKIVQNTQLQVQSKEPHLERKSKPLFLPAPFPIMRGLGYSEADNCYCPGYVYSKVAFHFFGNPLKLSIVSFLIVCVCVCVCVIKHFAVLIFTTTSTHLC